MTTGDELLGVRAAAAELGLEVRVVQRRIAQGKIAATKLGDNTSAYVITRDEINRVKAELAAAS